MNSELIEALHQLEREKGIEAETVLDALEVALAGAYERHHPEAKIRVHIDPETGASTVYSQELDEEGELVSETEITPQDFGRIAAQTAKQVILQRIRDAERDLMFEEYEGREGDIVTGIVQQSDQRYLLVNLGKVEALLPAAEQVPNERYDHGMRIKAYIVEVRKGGRDPQIIVSRSHPGLLRRLFELEVPEIYDGIVEIEAVAREAGYRSKIAVKSNDTAVDAVGSCVGPKGSRVRMVVMELKGEKIDVVQYSDDLATYVSNALSPAKVKEVKIDEIEHTAIVIVPDHQLSLAIGKEGQNARLAAKLTSWRIDIKSETQLAGDALAPAADADESLTRVEQCEAVKSNGERCVNKTRPGSKYCGIPSHRKLEEQS